MSLSQLLTSRDRHRLAVAAMLLSALSLSDHCRAEKPWTIDRTQEFTIALTDDAPTGECSIREHAIAWHPIKKKYYLAADVIPLTSSHHPNTYETEIHLWSSKNLAHWTYHGLAVPKGTEESDFDAHGVASPAGMAFHAGRLYVPYSARKTAQFTERSIGLAWSRDDPEQLPWTKSPKPISDLPGEDDDPAVLTFPGDPHLHLYHRRTGPGGYRIVHSKSKTPRKPGSWTPGTPAMPRPDDVRAQELTGAFFAGGKLHLFVIEHFKTRGAQIAHVAADRPQGPCLTATPEKRYLPPESQAARLAYSGHASPLVRDNRLVALFWTVPQQGKRYGLLGHPVTTRDPAIH